MLLLAAGILPTTAAAQQHSALWGERGERWTPASRLPDFSFAGYRCGEAPLPRVAAVANVRDFGAAGDGETDDTAAFRRAIEATAAGAILIPEGRYLLSDILWIQKPGLVLRGEGPDRTVLRFTTELEDVRPNPQATTGGRPTSGYSWSGGFVWFQGKIGAAPLASIVSEALRGDDTLTLAGTDADAVRPGQWIQLELRDDEQKSLLAHLYSGDPGDTGEIQKPITLRFASRVRAVDGTRLTLERPLRWDLRAAWSPRLLRFEPALTECGIEELEIQFPVQPYAGHFTERGKNAIAMNGAVDCWIRNVRIRDCDSGVFLQGSQFCSVEGLEFTGTREATRGDTGHHGVLLGSDCLLTDFRFDLKFIHDLTVTNLQSGNVFKNGSGRTLSFDHHKRAPFENLFCNMDVGDGAQLWRSGGGAELGRHCAARGTFWCIRSSRPLAEPPRGFGPSSLNLVGFVSATDGVTESDGRWLEPIPPAELQPADLHAAQLARRLGR